MKKFSVVLAGLLLGTAAQAADLASMQEMALGNREIVQRYITNVEKSVEDITLARGGYYPVADISYRA